MTDKIENSDIVKHILINLFDISRRKTTEVYAFTILDSSLRKLEEKYNFLKNVKIRDTRFIEDEYSVSVMSEINLIPPNEIGKAIHDIVILTNNTLGKNAGFFFIKELSHNVGDDYRTIMRDIGINLDLIQLENEVAQLEKTLIRPRKTEK